MPTINGVSFRSLKRYKYQTIEDFRVATGIHPLDPVVTTFIELGPRGNLLIKKGYAWDGCSGPTWDSKSSYRGGLVHDAGYQLLRMGLIPLVARVEFDNLFRDIVIEDGMWRMRANVWYHAVRKFGASSASPDPDRPDL